MTHFFKILFSSSSCKEATNIGGAQIRETLLHFFIVKRCPFCIFWRLPSVSKITPANTICILRQLQEKYLAKTIYTLQLYIWNKLLIEYLEMLYGGVWGNWVLKSSWLRLYSQCIEMFQIELESIKLSVMISWLRKNHKSGLSVKSFIIHHSAGVTI